MHFVHPQFSAARGAGARLALLACTAVCSAMSTGCSSWTKVRHYDQWTLYEFPGSEISPDAYEAAFEPAFVAVEEVLGPFEDRVRVHAWRGSVQVNAYGSAIRHGEDAGLHQIPGIGPARIQAYHARGGSSLFSPSGVFIGVPDAGTAVHELVHARLAEDAHELPLWFEEGLASLLGDGMLVRDRWVVDGLSYWPWRELREETFSDEELDVLLSLSASDESSVKENVLVHFVGWAIVFDLYRESGSLDWQHLYAEFDHEATLADARQRLKRTLRAEMPAEWLVKLQHPDAGVRLSTIKGCWKLRSREVLDLLLAALETEEDPEVQVGLAVNALAAVGEVRLGWRMWRRVMSAVLTPLRDAQLPDADEQQAAHDLFQAYQQGKGASSAQDALDRLARFWEE
jgi:hypothetical protein